MKILLDIDGVLNTYSHIPDDILAIPHERNPGTFCKDNIKAFLIFLDNLDEDYEILINSTWMYYHSQEVIRQAFVNNGFDGGKINFLKQIPGKTNSSSLSRVLSNPTLAKTYSNNEYVLSIPDIKEKIISIDDLRLWKAHRCYFPNTHGKIDYFQTNPKLGFNEDTVKKILE